MIAFDRHATLAASREDLRLQLAKCSYENDILRIELQNYIKSTTNEIMTLNNDVSVTKQLVERKKTESAELQLQIDRILQMASARTLARSQVIHTLERFNLYVSCFSTNF